MSGVFKGEGLAARFLANEAITMGNIVYLDDDEEANVGTVAQEARAVGVAYGGDYRGKTGTSGVVAAGNGVSVGFKGLFEVTAGAAIEAGRGVQAGNDGTVLQWDGADKLLGNTIEQATASGDKILVVF